MLLGAGTRHWCASHLTPSTCFTKDIRVDESATLRSIIHATLLAFFNTLILCLEICIFTCPFTAQVAMSTTCAIANDAAYNNALDKNTSGSRRKHQAIDEEFTEKMPEESHGCKMANISAQWLGHFDYRPVIEPEVVWPQLVLAKPNLLWHPVKASKPLSSNLLDKAYSKISINESQEVLSANRNPRPSHEGSNVAPKNFISTSASQEPAPFMRPILEKPRSYKPLEYFLSGTHVPWS